MRSTVIILLSISVIMIFSGRYFSYLMMLRKNSIDAYEKILYKKLSGFLYTAGFLLLSLSFFYFEGAYILSWKVWLIFWCLFSLVYKYRIWKYYVSIKPLREQSKRFRAFKKYLP